MFDWPERAKIVWFGLPPDDITLREAKNRELAIESVSVHAVPSFQHARAAVFWAPGYLEDAVSALERHAVRALDEGLLLHIVAGNDGQRKELERVLSKLMPQDTPLEICRIRTMPGVEPHEGPNKALIHDPGPGANTALEITGATEKLTDAHRLLLQRAFHNCRSIELQLISGGLSGALTYLVDARDSDSNAGPRPMPFFIKLDKPAKLRKEMRKFQEYAEHHVHWCLRPNFIDARRIYGVHMGILVGTFVPASKSLWEAVQEPNGRRHIYTLFEETLAGLRQDVPALGQANVQGSVVAVLEEFCRHDRIPAARVAAAAKWGIVQPTSSLWRKMLDLPPQHWRHGVMHGDMHGENVRVRKEDAIVIDFAHATLGPLSADLASLEVWIAFKIPASEAPDCTTWLAEVEYMYRPEVIDQIFEGVSMERVTGWRRECVDEIRQLVRTSAYCADEYKRVLAVYLLRHASFESHIEAVDEDEFRRAYAYWLANRMVLALVNANPIDLEAA